MVRVADGRFVSREMDNGNSSKFVDLGDLEDLGTWKDLEGLGRTSSLGGSLGDLGDLGVGEKFRLADFGATHAILPRSSRLWTQPKSCRPHARGLDFGPRSTHAKKRGSRIVRKCRGRADFGRGRHMFDPRKFAWVEQNLAPARFGPTLGLAKSGPGPMLARAQVRDPKISDAKEQSFFQKVSQGFPKGIVGLRQRSVCTGP